jgi:hypothetical protein
MQLPHTILGYNSPTEMPRAGGFGTKFQKMATATIQSFVDAITAKAAAETAVGTILSAIQREGDEGKVTQLFNQLPGAADLAKKHAVMAAVACSAF